MFKIKMARKWNKTVEREYIEHLKNENAYLKCQLSIFEEDLKMLSEVLDRVTDKDTVQIAVNRIFEERLKKWKAD